MPDDALLLSLDDRLSVIRSRWQQYRAVGTFECFVEFTVALNSIAGYLSYSRLPGLVRLCESIETIALPLLEDAARHPLPADECDTIERQIETLLHAIDTAKKSASTENRRDEDASSKNAASARADIGDIEWVKPRSVWIISKESDQDRAKVIARTLSFLGFRVDIWPWSGVIKAKMPPLAVLFMSPYLDAVSEEIFLRIRRVRQSCPASQLFFLGAPRALDTIVRLIRAGVDIIVPAKEETTAILNCLLDFVQTYNQEKYRVLVVEDSRVAVASIRRALADHGIASQAIYSPIGLLDAVEEYQPDLVLMDMYMPYFNGVEATRALRQVVAGKTLPIVYLSGESDIALQVEALRLGGDQFLTKPFNPVLLAAVVKTRIERNRATLRSSCLDSLTGLLNHTAAKERLALFVTSAKTRKKPFGVVMIDIDHFKSVNDSYGHPVGDLVIQDLAWLLKGRLRNSDLIGRYGGEEFIVALTDAEAEQVRNVIDQIRTRFEALPHRHCDGELYVTFSAGISVFPKYENVSDLINAADNALLKAKRKGRNQVILDA